MDKRGVGMQAKIRPPIIREFSSLFPKAAQAKQVFLVLVIVRSRASMVSAINEDECQNS